MYSFRSQYAKSLANEGKIQLAIQQFEISKQNTTTKEIFFQLGKLYKKIHQNKAAETQYLTLVRMFPELIEPKYMLAVIYYENRELGRLKNISDFMKDFNPKIDSDIGDQMKAEINDMYLQLLKSISNKYKNGK